MGLIQLNEVRTPTDEDFNEFIHLADDDSAWTKVHSQRKFSLRVFTRKSDDTRFKIIKSTPFCQKVRAVFSDVSAELLYDVLHDPIYRECWDDHMNEYKDVSYINPMNDICYYGMKAPRPLKYRDFVVQRSWIFTGKEYLIMNHSIQHKNYPPRKDYVRAISYLTGYCVRPLDNSQPSCEFTYIGQSDPKGRIPSWLFNPVASRIVPKTIKNLHKACRGYDTWKKVNNPTLKPWLYPEQLMEGLPRWNPEDTEVGNQLSQHPSLQELDMDNLSEEEFTDLIGNPNDSSNTPDDEDYSVSNGFNVN